VIEIKPSGTKCTIQPEKLNSNSSINRLYEFILYITKGCFKEQHIAIGLEKGNQAQKRYGLDIRSLGLFRISFGLVLIHNLYLRLSNRGFSSFFSQQGLIPIEYSNPFSYSVLNSITGNEITVMFIFISLVIYICYTIGYKTNVMKWLVVLILLTLFHRARFVTDGSDMMLRLIAIWTAFLPIGRRLSVDSIKEKQKTGGIPTGNFISYPLILFLLNLSISYILNAVQKDYSIWGEGLAVKRVLWDGWVINPLGSWARNYAPDSILSLLSEGTILIELAIGIMIIAALFGNIGKISSLFLIFSLHLGFSMFMYIGSFNWLYYPIALLFVPTFIWEKTRIDRETPPTTYYKLIDKNKIILPTVFGVYSLSALLAFNHIFPKEVSKRAEHFLYTTLGPINQVLVIGQQWFMYMAPDKFYELPVLEVIDKEGQKFDYLRNRKIYDDYFKDLYINPKNMGKYWVSYCFQLGGNQNLKEPLLRHLEAQGYKEIRWINVYQEISDGGEEGYPKYSSRLIFETQMPETIDISREHNTTETLGIQKMEQYGTNWLNNDQLLANLPKAGQDSIIIKIPIPNRIMEVEEDTITIALVFTTGPDFGKFRISQEKQKTQVPTEGININLYGPSHISTVEYRMEIDKSQINGNSLELRVSSIGKAKKSTGYLFGIDRIIINPWQFNTK
jgi:hypothetical protein